MMVHQKSVDIQQLFQSLTEAWKSGNQPTSMIVNVVPRPAYQRIIGLGPAAIPLILRELEREPAPWFWALEAITGENPIPEASRGRLHEMSKAWIE